ncbi:peptide-methionine (S)-S-oxide reductase MsrA [soil metagenome]
MNNIHSVSTHTVYFGNGCFWCTEAVFQLLTGVIAVKSGYSGGDTANPDYKSVCSGLTGHAECLEITYDSARISFEDLLEVFWKTHDPTTLNRQGNDAGTQYRSVIFYQNEEEKVIAEAYMEQLDKTGLFAGPIVTTLEPFTKFYPAENYHQNYYLQNGIAPYCQFVVRPKVEKFKKTFGNKLKQTL